MQVEEASGRHCYKTQFDEYFDRDVLKHLYHPFSLATPLTKSIGFAFDVTGLKVLT